MAHSRTVLLIAFHYPPCAVSSGLQRTLAFSRHLAVHGWKPVVLTVSPAAHERTAADQLADIPPDVIVSRTPAIDVVRHLAVSGRYWGRLAVPDRWSSWWFTAVPWGLRLVQKYRPAVIWSTYPITTAHRIGASLARMTGLPWVADFRDPMVEYVHETGQWFPTDARVRDARLKVEGLVAHRASAAVFCTHAALEIVRERYPRVPAERLRVIANGYEEAVFRAAEQVRGEQGAPGKALLLHSGTVYPGPDRDPTSLLRAIRSLADEGLVRSENFELRLRDPSQPGYFKRLAESEGVGSLVTIMPSLPYKAALAEMLAADGLLLLQGVTSNPAVPAKLYEYLRAGRPIVGLVHPAGETANTLRRTGISSLCSLTDPAAIKELLRDWLTARDRLTAALPDRDVVRTFSRESQTAELAAILEHVASGGARGPAEGTG